MERVTGELPADGPEALTLKSIANASVTYTWFLHCSALWAVRHLRLTDTAFISVLSVILVQLDCWSAFLCPADQWGRQIWGLQTFSDDESSGDSSQRKVHREKFWCVIPGYT